ncbi:hypothetical protein LMTR13_24775 [Bradyrhizobium icense]|uniref:Uncharacterized protein n=1 Tax=Bradyrhizobium icense TaxID=1274631 RepID=A0A1B1UJH8_9BRAD|nr:hypothetical protein LMTR13_24775 [Bradyrhizobium icense]
MLRIARTKGSAAISLRRLRPRGTPRSLRAQARIAQRSLHMTPGELNEVEQHPMVSLTVSGVS